MKQFDKWNEVKKAIDCKNNKVGYKPREIFWIRLGQNVGSEEYGKGNEFQRPVLIIKKLTSNLFMGIPLTSAIKENNDYFHSFEFLNKQKNIISKNSAMILQLKSFDKKRLMGKIGTINKKDFNDILEKTRKLFIPLD
jgi:mRNA interferase MazF